MSPPIHPRDLADILDAITFSDYALVKRQMALVEELQLDERDIVAKVGTLQVMQLAFVGRRFDLAVRGVEPMPAVMIGVLDRDGYTVVDLVAWPVDQPERMATFAGHTFLLGGAALDDMTTSFSPPLPVYRTALGWLKAGCHGVVPLDPHRAAIEFIFYAGTGLLAEDVAHGDELAAARRDLVDLAPPIMVAERGRAAA